MFDLWITLLHIVLVSGLITLAALVRKRSREQATDPVIAASDRSDRSDATDTSDANRDVVALENKADSSFKPS